ncbi:MAG: 4Fe-4S dicluster domain-containing protein [Anaerolineae bacterium]
MYLRADSSKCSGCRACLLACSLAKFGENNPKKARLAIEAHLPEPGIYEVRTCTQCGVCYDVCPVEAIHQNDEGAYYIDMNECTACMICVEECPERVIFVHKDYPAPFKCDLCGECVNYCGMNVLWIE